MKNISRKPNLQHLHPQCPEGKRAEVDRTCTALIAATEASPREPQTMAARASSSTALVAKRAGKAVASVRLLMCPCYRTLVRHRRRWHDKCEPVAVGIPVAWYPPHGSVRALVSAYGSYLG